METVVVESIPILVRREEDGRWWAGIEAMPGVMAYGATRDASISAVRALALRVAADCLEHGEEAGSGVLAQISKKAGLRPEDLSRHWPVRMETHFFALGSPVGGGA